MTNTIDHNTSKARRRQLIHERLYPVSVRPGKVSHPVPMSDSAVILSRQSRDQGLIGNIASKPSGSSNSGLDEHSDALDRVFAKTQSELVEPIAQPSSTFHPTPNLNKNSKPSRLSLLLPSSKLLNHRRRSVKRLIKSVTLIAHKSLRSAKKLLHHPLQAIVLINETAIFKIKQYWLGQPGELSWSYLILIGRKNIMRSFSRTAVTVGAIAAGSAAIVVLVGFAYGLESIVTKRLVQPNSLRLADVQSTSTAYQIDKGAIASLGQIPGVENVSMAVNLAGLVKYGDAQTEVVIVGARNDFLEASHVELVTGQQFSEAAETAYTGEVIDLSLLATSSAEVAGVVSGVTTEIEPSIGERVSDQPVSFRINDEVYLPLRSNPSVESAVLGYVRGSILDRHQGYRVWGGTYDAVGTAGRARQLSSGTWLGEWLQLEQAVPLYVEQAPTMYMPVVEATGTQKKAVGYITQNSISVLSLQEAVAEQALETLQSEQSQVLTESQVLGQSTESGQLNTAGSSPGDTTADTTSLAASTSANNVVGVVLDQTATSSAWEQQQLESMILQSQPSQSTPAARLAFASITKPGGKEILVSTGFLSALKLSPESVIGQNLSVQYIVSGGLVAGMKGKVTSESTEYVIVGVFNQDDQSMLFAPLSDLESMGVSKYSLAKVLAKDQTGLESVRERIAALGFRTRSIADTLIQVNKLFAIMRFLLGSFGMIAFIVALFGMFNTLTVSLLERTREIGVMKTLGTTDRDIRRLLIVESSLIGIAGGLVGVVLGVVLGLSLNWFSMLTRTDKTLSLFQFPPLFLLFVFLLAALVGMLTGLYPARRAHNISALNALRYE